LFPLTFSRAQDLGSADTATRWLKSLHTQDVSEKYSATFYPGKLDKTSVGLAPLIAALEDPNPFVRSHVAAILGDVSESHEALPSVLLTLLRDPDSAVRAQATVALAKIGGPAVPLLVEGLTKTSKVGVTSGSSRFNDTTEAYESDYAIVALTRISEPVFPELISLYRRTVEKKDSGVYPSNESFSTDDDTFDGTHPLHRSEKAVTFSVEYLRKTIRFIVERRDRFDISEFVPFLTDQNAHVRRLTAEVVANASKISARDVSALETALDSNSDDQETSLQLIRALSIVGPSAIPALIKVARTGHEPEVRAAAIRAIGEIVAPHLHDRGRDAYHVPEENIAPKLLEDVVPELMNALEDDSPAMVIAASESIQDVAFANSLLLLSNHPSSPQPWGSSRPRIIEDLTEKLRSQDEDVSEAAVNALGVFGKDAKPAEQLIMELLLKGGIDWTTRKSLLTTLASIGESDPSVIDFFVRLLYNIDKDDILASDLLKIIGNLNLEAAPLQKQLVVAIALRLLNSDLKTSAADLLSHCGSAGIAALMRESADYGSGSRERFWAVCEALRGASPEELEQVSSVLKSRLKSRNRFVRNCAVAAMAKTSNASSGLEALVSDVRKGRGRGTDGGPDLWSLALDAFDAEGPSRVLQLLEDPKLRNRGAVFESLSLLNLSGAKPNAALIRMLVDPDRSLREGAFEALHRISYKDPKTIPFLMRFLEDEVARQSSDNLSTVCAELASYGSQAASASPILLRLLQERNDPFLRSEVIVSLSAIHGLNPEARRAIMTIAQESQDADLRLQAVQTLLNAEINLEPEDERLEGMLFDIGILRLLESEIVDIAEEVRSLQIRPRTEGFAAVPPSPKELPLFPWPPPRYSHIAVFGRDFPRTLLGEDRTNLEEVYLRVFHALVDIDPNFESGLFSVPGGFALLTKVERILEDGTPYPERSRWSQEKIPPTNVSDYLEKLFVSKPGNYRSFAIVITDENTLTPSDRELPLFSQGGMDLPTALGRKSLQGLNCYALIYSWQRRPGGPPTAEQKLSALTHIDKSGLLQSLRNQRKGDAHY
jgi:HEAT repeat protein